MCPRAGNEGIDHAASDRVGTAVQHFSRLPEAVPDDEITPLDPVDAEAAQLVEIHDVDGTSCGRELLLELLEHIDGVGSTSEHAVELTGDHGVARGHVLQ